VLAVLTLQGTGEHVLVRRVEGNLLSPVLLLPDDEVLCRNVGSFNLRFYDGTLWWDSWDAVIESNELPVAVEVTLELEPADGSAKDWRRFVRVIPLSCAGQGTADDEADPSAAGTPGSETAGPPGSANTAPGGGSSPTPGGGVRR
jgi:hypothetical protein